jgi:hypothetical protein
MMSSLATVTYMGAFDQTQGVIIHATANFGINNGTGILHSSLTPLLLLTQSNQQFKSYMRAYSSICLYYVAHG